MLRHLRVAAAVAVGLLLQVDAASAEPTAESVSATMTCEHPAEPGRVKCAVEARAGAGQILSWADVVLVELPDFTAALKGRIGPDDASAHEPGREAWAFALVARRTGSGEVVARVRAVVCTSLNTKCQSSTVVVRAAVRVG
jgi:hypothetical protein